MAYEGTPPEINTARSSRIEPADSTRPASGQAREPSIPGTRAVTMIDVDRDGSVVKKRVTVDGDDRLA